MTLRRTTLALLILYALLTLYPIISIVVGVSPLPSCYTGFDPVRFHFRIAARRATRRLGASPAVARPGVWRESSF